MNDTTTKNPLHRGAVLVASLAAAGLLGLGSAPAALAHDTLLSSDPEADAELDEAPERIELTFSADIGDGGNAVALTDPSGKSHELDDPEVDGPDATVELDPLTEAGEYTVAYRMVSSDGHVVEDRFSFTLTEEAVAGAEQGAASPRRPRTARTPQAARSRTPPRAATPPRSRCPPPTRSRCSARSAAR
ncbi:copper resistance protein CopC [Nocardiopsis composta]